MQIPMAWKLKLFIYDQFTYDKKYKNTVETQ